MALVKTLQIVIDTDNTEDIEVPASGVLQRSHSWLEQARVTVKQSLLTTSLIFDVVSNLQELDLVCTNYAELPTSEIYGKFYATNMTSSKIPVLRRLRSLKYKGPGLNSSFVSLQALKKLSIGEGTDLALMGNQSTHVPNALEDLSITSYSKLLNNTSTYHRNFIGFTRHLVSLKKVNILINNPGHLHTTEEIGLHLFHISTGQFADMIAAFEPSRNTLVDVSFNLGDEHSSWAEILDYCLPTGSLLQFSALQKLTIPYEGLLSFGNAVQTNPTIGNLLPPTLKSLAVLYPKIDIYVWLKPLTTDTKILPRVSYIRLHCHLYHNHDYARFAFLERPNEVEDNLKTERGIEIDISHAGDHMPMEWDDYDLGAILFNTWQSSYPKDPESDRIHLPIEINNTLEVKAGSEERWFLRLSSCLEDGSWKNTYPMIEFEPIPEYRWIWKFVAGRWAWRQVPVV